VGELLAGELEEELEDELAVRRAGCQESWRGSYLLGELSVGRAACWESCLSGELPVGELEGELSVRRAACRRAGGRAVCRES